MPGLVGNESCMQARPGQPCSTSFPYQWRTHRAEIEFFVILAVIILVVAWIILNNSKSITVKRKKLPWEF